MIEKVSDFFKDVKERLSNPLIFAYLIAWCLYNWKIVIGILFFKSTELKVEGYDSYFDMIRCEVTWRTAVLLPLLSAVAYVLVFPFIRNGVFMIGAWFKTWGNEKVMTISKTGQVSVLKYIALREKYVKSTNDFVELLKTESSFLIENQELKKQIAEKQSAFQQELETVQKLKGYNQFHYFQGKFRLSYQVLSVGSFSEWEYAEIKIEANQIQTEASISILDNIPQNQIEHVIGNGELFYVKIAPTSKSRNGKLWRLLKDGKKEEKFIFNGMDNDHNTIKIELISRN